MNSPAASSEIKSQSDRTPVAPAAQKTELPFSDIKLPAASSGANQAAAPSATAAAAPLTERRLPKFRWVDDAGKGAPCLAREQPGLDLSKPELDPHLNSKDYQARSRSYATRIREFAQRVERELPDNMLIEYSRTLPESRYPDDTFRVTRFDSQGKVAAQAILTRFPTVEYSTLFLTEALSEILFLRKVWKQAQALNS